jgi:hypothetical protein
MTQRELELPSIKEFKSMSTRQMEEWLHSHAGKLQFDEWQEYLNLYYDEQRNGGDYWR